MPEGHGHSPMSHVVDHPTLDLPQWQSPYGVELALPNLFGQLITRFMLMELVAAVLTGDTPADPSSSKSRRGGFGRSGGW